MEKYTVKELKSLCKSKGISGYSTLVKKDLFKLCLSKKSSKRHSSKRVKSPKRQKNCQPGFILNPTSGRCVSRDGPTGRKILQGKSPKRNSKAKSNSSAGKFGNISNFMNDFRYNTCQGCNNAYNTAREKSNCLKIELTKQAIDKFLKEKLLEKEAKDGKISEADIKEVIDSSYEYLMDCPDLFEFIED